MMQFEWDPAKAKTNAGKHRIDFNEASTVFGDPLGITIFDPDHSEEEDRYITIGMSRAGRLLMIAHADRGDRIRIISARELGRKERDVYENEIEKRKG